MIESLTVIIMIMAVMEIFGIALTLGGIYLPETKISNNLILLGSIMCGVCAVITLLSFVVGFIDYIILYII